MRCKTFILVILLVLTGGAARLIAQPTEQINGSSPEEKVGVAILNTSDSPIQRLQALRQRKQAGSLRLSTVTKDGKVLATRPYEPVEMKEVIIELQGDPLIHVERVEKGNVAVLSDYRTQLNVAHENLKKELLQWENETGAASGRRFKTVDGIVKQEYNYVFNGLAARLSAETLEKTKALSYVKAIHPDVEVHANLSESVPLIKADRVWTTYQATGKGITVAVIDTGIDYRHPDLGGNLGPGFKVVGGYNVVQRNVDPLDDHGHGTHVAGIIAANGRLKGVAPEANLKAYKVLDRDGSGSMSDVIMGIELAARPDPQYPTRIMNLSLGGFGHPDDPVSKAIDNATNSGILCVVASGNDGAYLNLNSPASARKALTVGATDKQDHMAPFSSRGPAANTYQIKPEVVAPGVNILSTVPVTGRRCCSDPSGYASLSGTSMAAPHVAGAAALLLQIRPEWAPEHVKAALMENAVDLRQDAVTQGSGRIDVFAAVSAPALITSSNLNLGFADLTQPTYAREAALTLYNLGGAETTFTLSVETNLPAGSARISPSSVTLAGGESTTVIFSLDINNSEVPDQSVQPFVKGGIIKLQTERETLNVPFAFIKSPRVEFSFSGSRRDLFPEELIIHNRLDRTWYSEVIGSPFIQLLPQGSYDVIASALESGRYVAKENIQVSNVTAVNFKLAEEAKNRITVSPKDTSNRNLPLGQMTLTIFHKGLKIGFGFVAFGSYRAIPTPANLGALSDFSDSYLISYQAISYDDNYLTSGFRHGINGNVVFQNAPTDFKKVTLYTLRNPSCTWTRFMTWLCQLELCLPRFGPNSGGQTGASMFNRDLYYIPAADADALRLNAVQFTYSCSSARGDADFFDFDMVTSPTLELGESGIQGFLPRDTTHVVFTDTSGRIPIGIGPPHWFGKFSNSDRLVTIRPYAGSYLRLFTFQINDYAFNSLDVSYELYRGETLIEKKPIQTYAGAQQVRLTEPGVYTLKVPFTNYYVGSIQGKAVMSATFDTRKSDKDPPYMTSLSIRSDGEMTNQIDPAKPLEVRFSMFDDQNLSQVNLLYDYGAGWREAPLARQDQEFVGHIPFLPNEALVSLKISGADAEGNTLTLEINPAFETAALSLSNLFAPKLADTAGGWISMILNNAAATEVVASAAAYQETGRLMSDSAIANPYGLRLAPGTQIAKFTTELFGDAIRGKAGWAELSRNDPNVSGFFMTGDFQSIDSAPLVASSSLELIFPYVIGGDGFLTELTLVNPNYRNARASLGLVAKDGTTLFNVEIEMRARSSFTRKVADLFGVENQRDGYVKVTANEPLVGLESFGARDKALLNAMPLSPANKRLLFPYVVSFNQFYSNVSLINPDNVPQTVRLTLHGVKTNSSDRSTLPFSATLERTLAPNELLYESINDLFGLEGSETMGNLTAESVNQDHGLLGFVTIGTPDSRLLTSISAQQIDSRTEFSVPYVAHGGGIFTGLVVTNMADGPSDVTMEAVDPSGLTIASASFQLGGNGTMSGSFSEFFAGHNFQWGGQVRVRATQPISGLGLISMASGLMHVPMQ
jgi:subtilisin family serine protease